jgi:hypothetical protein
MKEHYKKQIIVNTYCAFVGQMLSLTGMFRQITEQIDKQNRDYAGLMTKVHIRKAIHYIKRPKIKCSRLV